MTVYRIVSIGSLQTGWALECDGKIVRAHPSAAVLGAYLDANLAAAPKYDADDIAQVMERRPWPSYEKRLSVFSPTGRLVPSSLGRRWR
jgi:hypothetical protein